MYPSKTFLVLLSIIFVITGLILFYFFGISRGSCNTSGYAWGNILVGFKENVSPDQARETIKKMGGRIASEYNSINAFSIEVPNLLEKIYVKKYERNSLVKSAELNNCLHLTTS